MNFLRLSSLFKRNKKYIAVTVLLLCCIAFVLYCNFFNSDSTGNEPYYVREKTYYEFFDTVTKVYSYAGDSENSFETNCSAIYDIFRQYNIMLDIYHEYSWGNNLCTVNKMAGIEPVKVDERIIDVIEYAKYIFTVTEGKTDVSMGSVLSLWHDCRVNNKDRIPTEEELIEAKKHSGFDKIIIDKNNSTVFITDKNMSIDVGAIGKGYVAEVAAKYLKSIGITSYVINLGGNIKLIGTKKDGSQWKTGIRNPQENSGSLALRLKLSDVSCVTSGEYERYFVVDGVKYNHIIDVDTLHPAYYFASVTVITYDSALADSLSTALFCMPYEQGIKFVERFEDVQCIWIFNDMRIEYTKGVGDILV